MANGRLDKPIFQLTMPLVGIDEAVEPGERAVSEQALAALVSFRVTVKDEGGRDVRVVPQWMDLYRRLREEGWDWRVAVYIAWAAQPKKYRMPATQDDLARECLGLSSDRSIATWRKRNAMIDETISMLQGSVIFESLPDAFHAMVDVATSEDYKGHADRKLMFEMAGVYTPSSKITAEMAKRLVNSDVKDLEELSDADLRKIEQMAGEARKLKSDEAGE